MTAAAHVPVLLGPVMAALDPARGGTYIDGTFGAGGYTTALLDGGADRVIAIDRDPDALSRGAALVARHGKRLTLVQGRFGDLDDIAMAADALAVNGITLDIGVSSMQLDEAGRGFSFMRDGPLDMRMEQEGPSAADLVNEAGEAELAEILWLYGEERASRRIARAILAARAEAPINATARLAEVIAAVMPHPRPGQPNPATRSFQALRIAVNDELGELVRALEAAERILAPGGILAVVTFHSLEDRIVKRFFQQRSDRAPRGSRYAPETTRRASAFTLLSRRPVEPDEAELAANPRARSARLRAGRRTDAAATPVVGSDLGLPQRRHVGRLQ